MFSHNFHLMKPVMQMKIEIVLIAALSLNHKKEVSSILFPWFSMLWRVDFWQQHRGHLKIWNRMFSCKFYVLNPIIHIDWALFVGDYHKKKFIPKVFPLYLYVFISYLWSFKSNMNVIETWNMLCFHIVFIFWIQICKVIHFNVNACISEYKEIVSFILFPCCSVFLFLVTCKSNRDGHLKSETHFFAQLWCA